MNPIRLYYELFLGDEEENQQEVPLELNSFHRPVVSVFDKKTGLFSPPFSVRHIGDAIREWDMIRKDSNTKIGKNPEDFDLRQIGHFDEQTGELISLKPATMLAGGV